MRQQSKVRIHVRGKVIGGSRPLICLPLMARDRAALRREAGELATLQPDMLEWRVDAFAGPGDAAGLLPVLQELRTILGEIPLIFTCRIDREGGLRHMTQENRLTLIMRAMESGLVDLVDIELCNDRAFIDRIAATAKALGVALILSYHNFQETPGQDFLTEKITSAERLGGDIAKVAVTPKDYHDVLVLLLATDAARTRLVNIPLVTIAMGETGKISRLAGGLFGSDITFAAGRESSAPGQMPLADLKTGMALLYGP